MSFLAGLQIPIGLNTSGLTQDMKTVRNGLLAMSASITGLFAASVYAAADFERSLNRIRVLSNDFNMDAAQKSIHNLAVKWGGETNKIAKGINGLMEAGLSFNAAYEAMNSVMATSRITGLEYERVIADITSTMTTLGMVAGKTSAEIAESTKALTNAYVLASRGINGSVEQMSAALSRAASGARKLGMSVNDTLSMLMVFADSGLGRGTDGGAAFNAMIDGLTESMHKHRDMWISMIKIDPISAVTGRYKEQTEWLPKLAQSLNSMGEDQAAATLTMMGFTGEQIQNTLAIIGNTAALEKYLEQLSGNAQASENAAEESEGFWESLNKLKAEFQSTFEVIGMELLPVIKDLMVVVLGVTENVSGFIKEHKELIVVLGSAAVAFGVVTASIITLSVATAVATGPIGWIALALGVSAGAVTSFSMSSMLASSRLEDLKKSITSINDELNKTTKIMDTTITVQAKFLAGVKKMEIGFDKTISQFGMLEGEKQLWELQRDGVNNLNNSIEIATMKIQVLQEKNKKASEEEKKANNEQIEALEKEIKKNQELIAGNEKLLNQLRLKQRLITQQSNMQEVKNEIIAIQKQVYAFQKSELAAKDYEMRLKGIPPALRQARLEFMQLEKSMAGEKAARDAVVSLREEISTIRLTADASQILALQLKGAGDETIELVRNLQGLKAHNKTMEDLRTKTIEWNKAYSKTWMVKDFKHRLAEIEQAFKMGTIEVETYHGKIRELREEYNSKLGVKVSLEGLDTFDASSVKFLKFIQKMRQASLSGVKLETKTAKQVKAAATEQDEIMGAQLRARNRAEENARAIALRTDVTPEQRGAAQLKLEEAQGMHSKEEAAYRKSQQAWIKSKTGILSTQSEIDNEKQKLENMKQNNASDESIKAQQKKVDNMFTQEDIDNAKKDMEQKRADWAATGDSRGIAEAVAPMLEDEIVYKFDTEQVTALTGGMEREAEKMDALTAALEKLRKAEEDLAELMRNSPELAAEAAAEAAVQQADEEVANAKKELDNLNYDQKLEEIQQKDVDLVKQSETGKAKRLRDLIMQRDDLEARMKDSTFTGYAMRMGNTIGSAAKFIKNTGFGEIAMGPVQGMLMGGISKHKTTNEQLAEYNAEIEVLKKDSEITELEKKKAENDAERAELFKSRNEREGAVVLAQQKREEKEEERKVAQKAAQAKHGANYKREKEKINNAQQNVADANAEAASISATVGTENRSFVPMPPSETKPIIPVDIARTPDIPVDVAETPDIPVDIARVPETNTKIKQNEVPSVTMDPELLKLPLRERNAERVRRTKEQNGIVDKTRKQETPILSNVNGFENIETPANIVSPAMPVQVPVSIPASRDPLAMGKLQKNDVEEKSLKYLEKIANNTDKSITIESASLYP